MDKFKKEANPAPEALNELLFSDDQGLINEDEKAIQAWTYKQSECCIEAYDKKISFSKTETMKVIRTLGDFAISIDQWYSVQANILAAFSHRMGT